MRNRVRELREAAGWTQLELAERVAVTRQTVIAIEKDRYNPTLALAFKLARAFGRTIEEIFEYEESGA